jgi:hypothetical protein
VLATAFNEQDAKAEITRSLERVERLRNARTTEEHLALWLEGRILQSYQQIRIALTQTKSPIEMITYLYLMEWTPCVGPDCIPIIHPQHKIEKYTADFMVEYGDFKFVIECDGHDFHEKTKKQAVHDKKRDREMTSKGYIVMRFAGSEIWGKPWIACNAIDDYLFEDSQRSERMMGGGEPPDDSHEN